VRTFRRYVAIGDSTTEGLDDPDGAGGYRGWADRLAEMIANAQAEPLDYALPRLQRAALRHERAEERIPAAQSNAVEVADDDTV
jgi:hypothetical protein